MSRFTRFVVFVVWMLVTTRAEAQDGGVGTSPPAVRAPDPVWECLRDCMARHSTCFDDSALFICYGSVPSCQRLQNDFAMQHEVLERMCNLCAYRGSPANSCQAPGAAAVSGVPQAAVSAPATAFTPNPISTAQASPSQATTHAPSSSSSSPPPSSAAPHHVRPRPLPPDVCRDHHPPLAAGGQACRCLRGNGVWTPHYPYTSPNGEHLEADTCLTPAFAALEGRVDHLEQRPLGVTEARVNEIVEAAAVQDRNRYDVQIIRMQDLVGGVQRELNTQIDRSSSSGAPVASQQGSSRFAFRLGPYIGVSSHQVPGGPNGENVVPFFTGLELNWMPSFAPAWYLELGFGGGYAGPKMFGREHLQVVAHTGFFWRPSGPFALGFGAQFMERLTPQMQGVGAFIGPYIEFMMHTVYPGFFIFTSVRLAPGADLTAVATDNVRYDFAFVGTVNLGVGYF